MEILYTCVYMYIYMYTKKFVFHITGCYIFTKLTTDSKQPALHSTGQS